MEQDPGLPFVSLSDSEQRYYAALHSLCQTDAGSGKLSAAKVAELLKASHVPPESLHQVTEVCGVRRAGFFSSAQFLVALKLLAACQTGLPISLESTSKDLPLPRFPGLQSDQDPRYGVGPQCVGGPQQDPRYGVGPQQDPRYGVGPQGLGPQQDPRYGVGPQGLGGPQQDPRYGVGPQGVGGPQQDPRYGVGLQGVGPQQDPRYGVGPQGLGPQQDPRYDAGSQGVGLQQDPRYDAVSQGVGPQQDPRYSVGPQVLGPKQDTRYGVGPQGVGPQQDPRYGVGPQGVGASSALWTPAERSTARLAESSVDLGESWSPTPSPLSSPPNSPPLLRHYPVAMAAPGASLHTANERQIMQQDHHSSPSKYRTKPPELSALRTQASLEQQRVSSEEGDPWRITEEQREYYTNQFKGLQPDLGALILGTDAKNFFTKSKLPIPELSHIWELSDVDRDGALTFSEFCTAFHLIVARKNGCPLPEALPPSLLPETMPPSSLPHSLLPETLALSLLPPSSLPPTHPPSSLQPSSLPLSLQSSLPLPCLPSSLPPCLPSSLPPCLPSSLPPSLQTSFVDQEVDSPETPGSAEPLIVFDDVELSSKQMDRTGLELLKPSLLKQEITSESDSQSRTWRKTQDSKHTLPGRPEPPALLDPQIKTRSRPRSYSSTSIDEAMKKAEEPPTPPPRPQKTHSRASSLDLNKLLQQGASGVRGGWLPLPPALPPRPLASQAPLFLPPSEKTPVKKPLQTNFTRFREEEENQEVHQDGAAADDLSTAPTQDLIGPSHLHRVPQKPVRRKFHPDNPEAPPPPTPASLAPPIKPLQKLPSKQKREIQTAIRKNKETNAVLTRLNSELQQQLKEVHQQRITLETQLDLLRPSN